MSDAETRSDEEVLEKLRALIDSLDEEPPTQEEAEEIVEQLGVDIKTLAAKVRAQVAAAQAEPPTKHDSLRERYERSRAKETSREPEPIRPRAEQLARIRSLLHRAKGKAVAAHFRKLEDVSDEELARLATALRDLLDEDEQG
jgi:hypothetical protein